MSKAFTVVSNNGWLVAEDGSSFLKAAKSNKEGEFFLVPNRIGRRRKNDTTNYKTAEGRFHYDKFASNLVDTRNQEYQTGVASRLMVHESLRQQGVSGECKVLVSLPLSLYFNSDQTRNAQNVQDKIDNIKQAVEVEQPDGSFKQEIIITDVEVHAEGLTALAYARSALQLGNKTILLVDIGSTTVDIIDFSGSSIEGHYSFNSSRDLDSRFTRSTLSMFCVLDNFAEDVARSNPNDYTTQEALQNYFIASLKGETEHSDQAHTAIEKFQFDLQQGLNKLLSENGNKSLRSFSHVLFSGGGSELINPLAICKNGLKTTHSQFDNAFGCLLLQNARDNAKAKEKQEA